MLLLLSLWTHNISDPTLNHSVSGAGEIKNGAGLLGAYLSGILADFFGLAAYVWPVFFLCLGAGFVSSWFVIPWWKWIGYGLLGVCLLTFAEAWKLQVGDLQGGGLLGAWLYAEAALLISPTGSALVWCFALLAALELTFGISWLAISVRGFLKAGTKTKEAATKAAVKTKQVAKEAAKKMPKASLPAPKIKKLPAGKEKESPVLDIHVVETPKPTQSAKELEEKAKKGDKPEKESGGGFFGTGKKKEPEAAPRKPGILPPIDLLKLPEPEKMEGKDAKANAKIQAEKAEAQKADLEKKGAAVIECLQSFGVQVTLARISPGPVVTMFEIRPDAGVKASRIAGLANDLGMALKSMAAVRIQAPIPGTDTVGIEVANATRATVNFRELLEDDAFKKSPSLLTMALGKDISGRPVAADLAKMPHLLVAGATGSGKSVCLNSLLLSFLYKAKPSELRLLLIDPKRVELAVYADLPHLVHPVVTEMDLAKNALLWAIDEMDRRYKCIEELGVRNVQGYNEKVLKMRAAAKEKEAEGQEANQDIPPLLPFLVIVIDELADLMISKGKEVESSIVRLGQLARAAGIHLIIATQRPSVDVVTGLIKANFPCRIAFQVSSNHDSRTILDSVGAETLLGRGDMLFKSSGGKLQRIHGAFVSDDEVADVVGYWKNQQAPVYEIDFSEYGEDEKVEAIGGLDPSRNSDVADDPIYAEAVQFVREQGRVSISLLQRRFRIGFNRAARFMEQLEKDGLVSAADSSKPRSVKRD